MPIPIKPRSDRVDFEILAVRRSIGCPSDRECAAKDRQRDQTDDRGRSIAIDKLRCQQPHKWQRQQRRPVAEPLHREHVECTAQDQMPDWCGTAQAYEKCYPETEEQRAESWGKRAADENERNCENQGAVGHHKIIETPLRT